MKLEDHPTVRAWRGAAHTLAVTPLRTAWLWRLALDHPAPDVRFVGIGRLAPGDRQRYVAEIVKPLEKRSEPVCESSGSAVEAHARGRFRNKTLKPVWRTFVPDPSRFAQVRPHVSQPNQSRGLYARFSSASPSPSEASEHQQGAIPQC